MSIFKRIKRNYLDLKTSGGIICFVLFIHSGYSQYILNGDFEINNAPSGIDQLDLTNTQFNSLVPFCFSFGSSSLTEIDLITTGSWDGGPQSGNWYVGIRGGGIDQFSMEISVPLIAGATYEMSFYDRTRSNNCSTPAPVEIGLSIANNNFGTLIYTSPAPTIGEWKPRVFTFTAPNNGQFITVRAQSASCWVKVDNFCLAVDTSCIELPEFVMPNVFTPNNDDVNDIFKPIKFKGMKQGKMTILNRWGQTVFETEDILNGWDGIHNNQQCTDGVYYWIVTYIDIFDEMKTETGFLTLIR
ncbi:MAG TPA: gliding motility-associated C-terminal domain-containing protein [Flavobacteriales bacterium]|nr:gliding motility-associated C-terminal domain-containing protein [Flavobacteriales bacterium]HRJ37732.1 gliding motility-associated C-terminal domain-containing protein [Flavobacteriales bacterium]